MHRYSACLVWIPWLLILILLNASKSCGNHTDEHELFMVTRDKVYKIDLETSAKTEITDGLRGGTAIDYDLEEKIIVLSDVVNKCLIKVDIETGNKTILTSGRISVPDGLAVDWIHDNVYWTDTGTDTLSVVSLDGKWRKKIFGEYLNEPRAIVLDPIEGWMFWSDWGDAKIERAGLDGSQRSKIVGDIGWPNGLALDFPTKRLYWIDAKIENICSSDYDGSNANVILESNPAINHPFALDQFEDWLYWDDWRTGNVYRAEKLTGEHAKIIASDFTSPMGLRLLHSSKQPKGRNHCAEFGKCSHMCFPVPRVTENSTGFKCDCPNGMELADNQEFCTGTPDNNCEYDPSFICASGRCIKASWVCDGENDCHDNSDEQNCTRTTTTTSVAEGTTPLCPPDRSFKCENGVCIRASWICDGDNDCTDNSDEKNCGTTSTTHTPQHSSTTPHSTAITINCPYAPAFFCLNGRACIKRSWICDGDRDCSDGSDERNCGECPSTLPLPCGNGRCIRRQWLCDGDDDCGNDEENCTLTQALTTEEIIGTELFYYMNETETETETTETVSHIFVTKKPATPAYELPVTILPETHTSETEKFFGTLHEDRTTLHSTPSHSMHQSYLTNATDTTEGKTADAGSIEGVIFGILLGLIVISAVGFYVYKQYLRRNTIINLENPLYQKQAENQSNGESTKDNVILPI